MFKPKLYQRALINEQLINKKTGIKRKSRKLRQGTHRRVDI